MNRVEHYLEAERLDRLAHAAGDSTRADTLALRAQTHALLAGVTKEVDRGANPDLDLTEPVVELVTGATG